MIGHPTETDEDVIELARLLNRIGALLKQYQGRQINVTISPFCPKPLTPFQWENQDSVETLTRKFALIKDNLRSKWINLKLTNFNVSMLENLLGRGGRPMNRVILEAWKRGCRLDGWSEHFKGEEWRSALEQEGIIMENGGGGSQPGLPLPWGHLFFGIDEPYLLVERERAYRGETTSDCSEDCHRCGPYAAFCDSLKKQYDSDVFHRRTMDQGISSSPGSEIKYGRKKKAAASHPVPFAGLGTRIRLKFAKNGLARFIGHLDMIRIFDRTLRRSQIPVAYTQGYHPHPKISFGYPLPHGMKSIAEYVDFSLSTVYPGVETALRNGLPEGFSLIGIRSIPDKAESLNQTIKYAEYYIRCALTDTVIRNIEDLIARDSIYVERRTKKGEKEVNIRPAIVKISVSDNCEGFTMLLGLEAEKTAKPMEVLQLLFGEAVPGDVTRTEQYAVLNGEMVSPLEVLIPRCIL
jgi:radical SAM-linked protein